MGHWRSGKLLHRKRIGDRAGEIAWGSGGVDVIFSALRGWELDKEIFRRFYWSLQNPSCRILGEFMKIYA